MALNHLRSVVQDRMTDKMVVGSGLTAAGASSVPTNTYGAWLTTNGAGVLSWAEWIQVMGAAWVGVLLVTSFVKLVKSVFGKNKNND